MNISKIITITLALCFSCSLLLSQEAGKEKFSDEYRVMNWNEEHGLPAPNTNVILKDAFGFY